MKPISKLVLMVVGGLLLAGPAVADRKRQMDFDRVAERQQARIEQGIRRGDLTRDEARKLLRQQEKIEKALWRHARDGRLSRQERRKIQARYQQASERIYRLRHNDERRPDRAWRTHHRQEWSAEDYSNRRSW